MNRAELKAVFPNASEQFLRENSSDGKPLGVGIPLPVKQRLRQKQGDGMNKTERAFFEWLREQFPTAHIHREVGLPLGNGVRYLVDFLVVHGEGALCAVTAYEVKGHMRDDAAVKLKVAASLYRWIQFTLVWRTGRASPWQFQHIQP